MRQRVEFPTVVKKTFTEALVMGLILICFSTRPPPSRAIWSGNMCLYLCGTVILAENRGREGIHLKAGESRSLEMKPLWVHHCIPRILTRPQSRLISDWVEIPRDRCANVYRWSSLYLLSPALSLSFCFETKTNLLRRESRVCQTPI